MSGVRPEKLRITRRSISVLVSVTHSSRTFDLRPFWVVLAVMPDGAEVNVYHGRDDGVIGWVDCCDWAHATVKQARERA